MKATTPLSSARDVEPELHYHQASVLVDRGRYAEAAILYQKSSELGHAKSTHSLAFLYDEGMGVAKNPKLAKQLYEIAAENGVLDSVYMLAMGKIRDAYELPSGKAKNKEFRSAMRALEELGTVKDDIAGQAILSLAQMHAHGLGTKTDAQKARELLREAAEKGNSHAQCMLGMEYASAENPRMRKAAIWLGRAARQNDPNAKEALRQLFPNPATLEPARVGRWGTTFTPRMN